MAWHQVARTRRGETKAATEGGAAGAATGMAADAGAVSYRRAFGPTLNGRDVVRTTCLGESCGIGDRSRQEGGGYGKPERRTGSLNTYIDGKMNRYKMLFAVNGGAFAIGQLILQGKPMGGLTTVHLSFGVILFTLLVHADIWFFGTMMQRRFLRELAFQKLGRAVEDREHGRALSD